MGNKMRLGYKISLTLAIIGVICIVTGVLLWV